MSNGAKILWLWDDDNKVYVKAQCDENGYLKVDMSEIGIGDLSDVTIAGLADGHFLSYSDGLGYWQNRVLAEGDIPAAIARDAEVTAAIAAHHDTIIKDADADTKVDVEESADEDKIRMDVKGVEAFLLHDDGILDLAKQSRASAYRDATNQVVPTGVDTKIEFNAEMFDEHNEFDSTTNYRFTATRAGYYFVVVQAAITPPIDGTKLVLKIRKNDVTVAFSADVFGAAKASGLSVASILSLAANDYVEGYLIHDSGGDEEIYAGIYNTAITIVKLA